jgi:hypothetical protein
MLVVCSLNPTDSAAYAAPKPNNTTSDLCLCTGQAEKQTVLGHGRSHNLHIWPFIQVTVIAQVMQHGEKDCRKTHTSQSNRGTTYIRQFFGSSHGSALHDLTSTTLLQLQHQHFIKEILQQQSTHPCIAQNTAHHSCSCLAVLLISGRVEGKQCCNTHRALTDASCHHL